MNSKEFLKWGGIILLIFGVLGYITPTLGSFLSLTPLENIAHILLGVVALGLVYWGSESFHKPVTIAVGLIGLLFAVIGFAVAGKDVPNLGSVQLDNPLDNLIHLVVGVWALWAALGSKKTA